MGYPQFLSYFIYKVSIYTSIFLLLWWAFTYYQNNISPATLPQHTISNGKQTIIFQTMSHIASEQFYRKVVKDLISAKRADYVLYYEWVTPGSEENNTAFHEALWINFAPWLYENFSKLYGVAAQNNNDFLWLVNNLDYNIDLSIDNVMDLYREKIEAPTGKEKTSLMENQVVFDVNTEITQKLSSLWDRELLVLRYINQSILNFMIKHEWLRDLIISQVANNDIFSVILDDRNKHMVNEILLRDDKKIFISYGLMHFRWVLDLLQTQDPNWEIISSTYSQIIVQD